MVLASEMESAALFVVSSYLGARAAAVFLCVNNQELAEKGLQTSTAEDTDQAIQTAIEALRIQIRKDKR